MVDSKHVSPHRVLLGGVLVLAAILRFSGLSWGLRHTPHWDERVFVENAVLMVSERDLDHRYYEYPGLFFYLLYPPLALAGLAPPAGAAAYLLVRGVVAAFGVAAVAAAYALGVRLIGRRGGLAAALLLAVSPLDVATAHEVRPDVVLQFFVLVALLAFRRVGASPRGDLIAGASAGACTAVKFTGALLAPSYLAQRLLTPGPRGRGVVLAALAGAAALVALTPYAILNFALYSEGVRVQWTAHYYTSVSLAARFVEHASYYLGASVATLGPLGSILSLVGIWTACRQWRTWLPLLLHPLTTLVVLSTADLRFSRHLVPAMGVLVLLAGLGAEALARGRKHLVTLLIGAAAVLPLGRSATYVARVARPGTWDRTLDWVESHAREGDRIVTTEADLGLDRARFEVVLSSGQPELDRLLAREVDLVIAGHTRSFDVSGLRPVLEAAPDSPQAGSMVTVYEVPDALRPRYLTVPLASARLTASENPGTIDAVRDADETTAWSTAEVQRPDQWVQVELPSPVRLARVELVLGNRPQRYARDLHLLVSEDGTAWTRVRVVPGRAPVEEQGTRRASEVLLLEPVRVQRLRLVQAGAGERRWGFAELRLDALP